MKFIPNALAAKVGRQVLAGQKNSPALLFGAGVVGVVGSTILACRATLKVEEVLHTMQNDLMLIENMDHSDYSENDRKQDKVIAYSQGVRALGKLYGPSIVLGAVSIAALTRSHNILSKRNAALTAAYAAVEKGFAEYRSRVVDQYGEDKDRELRYGAEKVTIEDDAGHKKNVIRVAEGQPSIYARFFDPVNSQNWCKEPEYNLLFLRNQQQYANDLLHARGHVLLNDVYDSLGIERSKAGMVVGWVLGSDTSDNHIDFGIWDGDSREARDFVNGREGSILLDFNVDGVVFDKIGNQEKVAWQS